MNLLRGIVHGKTIELAEELGLPDGQVVTVTVCADASKGQVPCGEGLRQAFGGWADEAEELDKFLEWNRGQRQIRRREIEP